MALFTLKIISSFLSCFQWIGAERAKAKAVIDGMRALFSFPRASFSATMP
jgi:hypothetical protein